METAPNIAWVQALQTGSCEQCKGQGCGSSKLGQLFCNKPRQFQVDNPIGAQIGDEVIVAVVEGTVLRSIALVYILPLVLLLLGAMLAGLFSDNDLYAAAGGGVGVALGFVLAKWLSSRAAAPSAIPYIARKA
jgi:sigma-E factor negative regulatory protein RseC